MRRASPEGGAVPSFANMTQQGRPRSDRVDQTPISRDSAERATTIGSDDDETHKGHRRGRARVTLAQRAAVVAGLVLRPRRRVGLGERQERGGGDAVRQGQLAVLRPVRRGVQALRAVCGKAAQVDPMKPMLNPPKTQRFRPKYVSPLSTVAFSFNKRRYSVEDQGTCNIRAADPELFEKVTFLTYLAGACTRPPFGST